MTKKIFNSIFLVAIVVFISCLVLIMGILFSYYEAVQETALKTELSLAVQGVEQGGISYLDHLKDMENRFTWVSADGTVLFDSKADGSVMENHGQRQEIVQALENGTGQSSRYSHTLTMQTLYYAQKLDDGTVLRISVSSYTIFALILSLLYPFVLILAIAMGLSLFLADRLSKRIVKPLESLNLDKPLENETYKELTAILTKLELQYREIDRQREELAERKKEMSVVISSMKEGLVLLNGQGIVLSINLAAKKFFGITNECCGESFLYVERSSAVIQMVDDATQYGKAELRVSRHDKEYQLSASRVENKGALSGIVILIFDITDEVFAERNRKEFTANVSHELKTPLQSIMGCAELLENHLVREQDIPKFVSRINNESSRLVSLIDDILFLSLLDEKANLKTETIDMKKIAEDELKSLQMAAREKSVTLSLRGSPAFVKANRQLLREIVHNVCENAIKYNIEGGSVTVFIKESKDTVSLRVKDTGIGIAHQDQDRIFERFYRVDKSHSSQTEGTGLGLSIVKHAVTNMNGTIELESDPGKGTTVTVTLPKDLSDFSDKAKPADILDVNLEETSQQTEDCEKSEN